MSSFNLLIVDDEAAQRETLSGFLKKKGFQVFTAADGNRALEIVRSQLIDLVLTDLRMPEMDGLELLRRIKAENPEIAVLVMTAFGSIEKAIEAMKAGAFDFVVKPINLEQLEINVSRALEHKQLLSENRRLQKQLEERRQWSGLIGSSQAMQQVMSLAARAAESKATVLITGESGVGKEVIARAIHQAGPRADKPFVAVNIAALSENLVESELFGHEKGAFTGAQQMRKGRFEIADGGTLFIDEVGDIPPAVQVKLLRALQELTIERIGSSQPIRVDVRIIAATHRPLEELVKQGGFREDLYYRLNVIRIFVPPLRERKSDIPLLADHFIKRFSEIYQKPLTISREAMDLLLKYDYPGNVRELENIIEQAAVLCRGDVITSHDLPATVRARSQALSAGRTGTFAERVAEFEKALIREALEANAYNQSRAAAQLGMSERLLRYKLAKYGLKPQSKNNSAS
ncbi:MAG: sigma-54 dependent transcriptional regulator [candidate division KSB1 bacterium]|nr:sigma-54 dependent transcriptional regulator [candidate division KSB1 bacterium]